MLMLMLSLGWRSLALREETVFEPAKTGLEPAYLRLESRRVAVRQRAIEMHSTACCQIHTLIDDRVVWCVDSYVAQSADS